MMGTLFRIFWEPAGTLNLTYRGDLLWYYPGRVYDWDRTVAIVYTRQFLRWEFWFYRMPVSTKKSETRFFRVTFVDLVKAVHARISNRSFFEEILRPKVE